MATVCAAARTTVVGTNIVLAQKDDPHLGILIVLQVIHLSRMGTKQVPKSISTSRPQEALPQK